MTLKLLFLATIDQIDLAIAMACIALVLLVIGIGASSEICKKLDEIKDILTKKDK